MAIQKSEERSSLPASSKDRGKKGDFRIPFSIGMLITLTGAYADAWWHLHGLAAQEGFFTPAHGVLYSGVLIMAVSIILWIMKKLELPVPISRRASVLMRIGIVTMFAGAVFDFWWHSTFGFDTVAWTPPHLTATAGFLILMTTATVSFGRKSAPFVKAALISSILLFIALWATVIILTA